MRYTITKVLAVAFVAALLAAPLHAQTSSAKSVESLNALIKELGKIRTQTQASMDALNTLTSGSSTDLVKNFKAYTKNVDGISKTMDTAQKRADDLKSRREAYLAEWQKKMEEVTNPDVKAHMAERKETVRKTFESVQPSAQKVKETFPTYLSDLKDIQSLLSVDLSQSGVAAAAPVTQKAVGNGNTILTELDTLVSSLEQIRDQVSPKAKG